MAYISSSSFKTFSRFLFKLWWLPKWSNFWPNLAPFFNSDWSKIWLKPAKKWPKSPIVGSAKFLLLAIFLVILDAEKAQSGSQQNKNLPTLTDYFGTFTNRCLLDFFLQKIANFLQSMTLSQISLHYLSTSLSYVTKLTTDRGKINLWWNLFDSVYQLSS